MLNGQMSILVSGASGIVGYGILKSLRRTGREYYLYGSTIYDESPAACFSDEVLVAPISSSPNYTNWLINTINEKRICAIFPGIEIDMEVWNNNRNYINESGCVSIINNSNLIDLCLDKWNFYNTLDNAGVDCRIKTTIDKEYGTIKPPFVVKPRKGFGSKGFKVIHSEEEYKKYCFDNEFDFIMQELVGTDEEEYTVAAFFGYDSRILALISLKRKLSKQGFTEVAEVVDIDKEIIPVLEELAELFRPIGPTDFQFRRTSYGWKLLEINPRISSSTSIRTLFGYNEAEMSIDYFLRNVEITQPQIRYGKAIRYTEDYIIE